MPQRVRKTNFFKNYSARNLDRVGPEIYRFAKKHIPYNDIITIGFS
jgi:hypothetical protein